MDIFQVVIFIISIVGMAVVFKVKFPFKRKTSIKLALAVMSLLALAYSLDVPLIPTGALTGNSPTQSGASLKSVFDKVFSPPEKQIIFQQPKEASEADMALNELMKDYSIPEQRKNEFFRRAEDVIKKYDSDANNPVIKEFKNDAGQSCSQKVVTQCS